MSSRYFHSPAKQKRIVTKERKIVDRSLEAKRKQDPEVNDASSSHFFIFHFFTTFSFFTLLVAPSSSSLLPPRRSFLLVPPSSSSLLPLCSSFFLVQHCLNHLESIKGHFSSILTKAQRTDGPTNGPTDGRTRPLIQLRVRNLRGH